MISELPCDGRTKILQKRKESVPARKILHFSLLIVNLYAALICDRAHVVFGFLSAT